MIQTNGYRLSEEAMDRVHAKSLEILERIGMKIMYTGFYDTLIQKGAVIDRETNVVKFPARLVEETIAGMRQAIKSGEKQFLLNGVTSPETDSTLKLKVAGASIEFLDPITREIREPLYDDLVRLVAWGESIPEVTYVGNPVCYLKDQKGARVPGRQQRVRTAAVVAKYTSKYGSNEVWDETELDLLIELGEIVRGGKKNFFDNPCFVTAKETIDPLFLPEEDGRILHMLAKRKLPCTIIPMPITGVSCPASVIGNIVMTCAEVLGVMTCLRAVCPESMVGGGVISGVMDMREGFASFAAPETLIQDMGAASMFKYKYGQNFAIGTGYIDAAFPGAQSSVEIFSRIMASKSIGHCYYPIGLLFGGKRWSPEQAYIGIEMAKYAHRLDMAIDIDDEQMPFDLFDEVGISGNYLGEDHTVMNFRKNIWLTDLMERSLVERPGVDVMVENARQKWSDFLSKPIQPAVSDKIADEIDRWEEKSIKVLTNHN